MATARTEGGGAGRPPVAWTVVLPIKGGPDAKTRLTLPHLADRTGLSLAIALDTLDAVLAASRLHGGHGPATDGPRASHASGHVAGVIVVTGDQIVAGQAARLGAEVVADPAGGLNAAVEAGITTARTRWPRRGVAVLLADLPALRPTDLNNALAACAARPSAVVPDRQGTGTVLLTALPAVPLRPAFGAGSAARHARFATTLTLDLPGLRTDVDDADALAAAVALGVGPRTSAIVGALTDLPVTASADQPECPGAARRANSR